MQLLVTATRMFYSTCSATARPTADHSSAVFWHASRCQRPLEPTQSTFKPSRHPSAVAAVGHVAAALPTIRYITPFCLVLSVQPGKLVPTRDATPDVLDRLEEAVLAADGKTKQDDKDKKKAAKAGRAVTPVGGKP